MAPSAKNPNGPSRLKQVSNARRAKSQQERVEQLASKNRDKVAKQDGRRGGRVGILPSSGPNKALSRKKTRKIERALGHALRRKEEEDAKAAAAEEDKEVDEQMNAEADAAQSKKAKKSAKADAMEVDE